MAKFKFREPNSQEIKWVDEGRLGEINPISRAIDGIEGFFKGLFRSNRYYGSIDESSLPDNLELNASRSFEVSNRPVKKLNKSYTNFSGTKLGSGILAGVIAGLIGAGVWYGYSKKETIKDIFDRAPNKGLEYRADVDLEINNFGEKYLYDVSFFERIEEPGFPGRLVNMLVMRKAYNAWEGLLPTIYIFIDRDEKINFGEVESIKNLKPEGVVKIVFNRTYGGNNFLNDIECFGKVGPLWENLQIAKTSLRKYAGLNDLDLSRLQYANLSSPADKNTIETVLDSAIPIWRPRNTTVEDFYLALFRGLNKSFKVGNSINN